MYDCNKNQYVKCSLCGSMFPEFWLTDAEKKKDIAICSMCSKSILSDRDDMVGMHLNQIFITEMGREVEA